MVNIASFSNIVDVRGWNVLHHACALGDSALVTTLVTAEKENIEVEDTNGDTPMHCAAVGGSVKVVDILIKAGGNVNYRNHQLKSPLHFACKKGHDSVVNVLIEADADINIEDKHKMTPLHYAAMAGNASAVKLLLERGADVDAKNYRGRTPLHVACNLGHLDVVKELISSSSVMLNVRDKNGYTPLHCAVSSHRVQVAVLLLNRGANPYIKTKHDHIAWDFAASLEVKNLIKQFNEKRRRRAKGHTVSGVSAAANLNSAKA